MAYSPDLVPSDHHFQLLQHYVTDIHFIILEKVQERLNDFCRLKQLNFYQQLSAIWQMIQNESEIVTECSMIKIIIVIYK